MKNNETGKVIGVINIDIPAALTEDQLNQVKLITDTITKAAQQVDIREKLTRMSVDGLLFIEFVSCNALLALEWIKTTTNAKGAYFGLLKDNDNIHYVSSSTGNEHMIGKTLKRGK